jgi:Trypsin-like serine proteases, typically periplasmic, contain C-terminal PDZ domain
VFPWLDLLGIIIRNVFYVYFDLTFWLVLGLVAFQYRQMQKDQIRMFGVYSYSLYRQVAAAALLGTAGGVIGSFVLAVVGVTLNNLGLEYIWPVVIALMLINLRFMCFAYAGGLVALANVLFGWPDINVPQVLALVAGLHVTESILIFISGRYGAVPLILKRDDGRLVGAFTLQNFWPLPLLLLMAFVPAASLEVLNMPDWWPLLPMGAQPPGGGEWTYRMIPVVAALGYADIAVSSTPAERRRQSALHLAAYSIVLLVLAVLSARYVWLQFFAAILSPLGHELLIRLDNRWEMRGTPRFVPPSRGVMVLDTVAATPARQAGLRPGDVIVGLGGMPVDSGLELARAISFAGDEFDLAVSRSGRLFRRRARFGGKRRLGVILVPEGQEQYYVQLAGNRFGLIDWLKNRFKKP